MAALLINKAFVQFGRGYYEFEPVVQMLFKTFLIWSSGGHPVWWSQTIYAILKEGIIESIHVCEVI